jgi:hypothetical protein
MSAPATKPKRVRYKVATDPLDLKRAVEVLAADDASRMAGPRATPCRCARPWPIAGECVKCGRRVG